MTSMAGSVHVIPPLAPGLLVVSWRNKIRSNTIFAERHTLLAPFVLFLETASVMDASIALSPERRAPPSIGKP